MLHIPSIEFKVFFIIPGIYLAVRWMFAEFYVIEQGMRPLEALKASSALTEGSRWELFFFSCLALLLILGGFVLLIVGGIVASIVVTFAYIRIYKDLQEVSSSSMTAPLLGE